MNLIIAKCSDKKLTIYNSMTSIESPKDIKEPYVIFGQN